MRLVPLILACAAAAAAQDRAALLARADEVEQAEDARDERRLEVRRLEGRCFDLAGQLERLGEKDAAVEQDPVLRARKKSLLSELSQANAALEQARAAASAPPGDALPGLLQALDRALEATPGDLDLRLRRGELLGRVQRWSLAREDAQAVAFERPEDPRALLLLARSLVPENRFHEAEKLLAQARKAGDGEVARACHALLFAWTNRFREAAELRPKIAGERLPPWLRDPVERWLSPAALTAAQKAWSEETELRRAEAKKDDLPRVELETSRGKLVLELFEDQAPNATGAFLELVEAGFYDGLPWHKVTPNLLALTGDPRAREGAPEGTGPGPGWRVKDEAGPGRRLFRGSLALVRGAGPDSAGSQVLLALIPRLEADAPPVTVFGRVVDGMQVMDALRRDDRVVKARVVRKREHPYFVPKVPGDR